jgi:succinylglutamate desuccinylase
VVVTAVVHGNELCGAITVDRLLRENIRPSRGTLTFGFMNVAALLSFDPDDPHGSRFVDEDFNRLWAEDVLDSDRSSAELIRAREVRPLIHDADVLLDIHSMTQMSQPLMMAGPVAKGRALARQIGIPRTIVSDSGHPQGKRMRDYSPFIDESSDKNALLVECGLHWAAASVGVAMDSTIRFLRVTGAIDEDTLPGEGTAKIEPADCFEVTEVVTVKSEQFRFEQPFQGGEVIPAKGSLLATDGDTEIRSAHDNCLIVMPAHRLVPGQTAVRLARPIGPEQA